MTPPHTNDNGDFKREVIEDADRVARLDAALENRIMSHIREHIVTPIQDHETRLRGMERWQSKTIGVHMVVGIVVMAFMGVCTSIVTKNIEQVLDKIPTATTSNRR